MQDIAEKAKVSRGTVSYVLNGKAKKAKISKATSEKIFNVAESLGYRRNAIAQSMKTGKTNVIGVVGKLGGSYCMEIIKGINDVLSKNNYMIKLLPSETVEQVKNVTRQCIEQRLAGVICRSLTEKELEILRKELETNNIPIVLVDSSFSHNWCSRIISDDFEGAKKATEYLLKLGHREIGFVTNNLKRGFSQTRFDGYIQTMAKYGIKVDKDTVCIIGPKNRITDTQRNSIKNFLQQQKPSAIFCSSDSLAMKVINIAHSLGIMIPEDLSIIGFAGLDYTFFSSPTLTTVKQPFVKMGQKASEILLSEIKEKSSVKEIKIPVKLIIHDSTKTLK